MSVWNICSSIWSRSLRVRPKLENNYILTYCIVYKDQRLDLLDIPFQSLERIVIDSNIYGHKYTIVLFKASNR